MTTQVVRWGTDPEAFFRKGDKIVGSERFIPEEGITTPHGKIVRDGVQFELNPNSAPTVMELGTNLAGLFKYLQQILDANPGLSIDFSNVVDVDKEELLALSPASQRLGCKPSKNFYGFKPIEIDPMVYLKRSSGGHIHMELPKEIYNPETGVDFRERMVPLLDIFVGLMGTMLDKDPTAIERRKNYGRAGEYRLPKYGLEYRTPSNFWLRDYTLMSLLFSQVNVAVTVLSRTLTGLADQELQLANMINIDHVERAINKNEVGNAKALYRRVMNYAYNPYDPEIKATNMATVYNFFVDTPSLEGLFPNNTIIQRWTKDPLRSINTYFNKRRYDSWI